MSDFHARATKTLEGLWRSFRGQDVSRAMTKANDEQAFWLAYRTHQKPEVRELARKMLRLIEEAEIILRQQPHRFEEWLADQGRSWHSESLSRQETKPAVWHCPKCRYANEEFVAVCGYCGASLVHKCLVCGGISFVTQDLCPACGASHRAELQKHEREIRAQVNEIIPSLAKSVENARIDLNLPKLPDETLLQLKALSGQVRSWEVVTTQAKEARQRTLQAIDQGYREIEESRIRLVRRWIHTGRSILAYVWLSEVDNTSYSSVYEPWLQRARWWTIAKATASAFLGAIALLLLGILRFPTLQSSIVPGNLKLLAAMESFPQARLQIAACLLVVGGTIGLFGALYMEVNGLLGLASIFVVNWLVLALITSESACWGALGFFQIIPALYLCVIIFFLERFSERKIGRAFDGFVALVLMPIGAMVGAAIIGLAMIIIIGSSSVNYEDVETIVLNTTLLIGVPLGALVGGSIPFRGLRGFTILVTLLTVALLAWSRVLWQ